MKTKHTNDGALPLISLNHISLVCRSLEITLQFYRDVLGFVQVQRPEAFEFKGAWLFNYGIGIHLLQTDDPEKLLEKSKIDPKDKHISFQCEDIASVEKKLDEMEIEYVHKKIEEGVICIDQLFFNDPDGFMIEVCNCDDFPLIPLEVKGSQLKTADKKILKC